MKKANKQIKSPKSFGAMVEKYGPGFVALSESSGRIMASGKNVKEVWDKVKDTKLFKENKIRIRHVPPPKTLLAYGETQN